MKKIRLILLISILSSLVLIGCGNSSSSNETTTNSDSNSDTSGNNGSTGGDGTTTVTQKGVFVDAPVANLKYTTDSKNGFTDYDGYAEYIEGESCTFFLGDLELGSMTCTSVMSVYEIVGDTDLNYPSQKTKNIARILQSLNESSDSDRIILDDSMKNFEKPSGLNLDETIDDTVMNQILVEANTKKGSGTYSDIGEDTAVSNMKSYMEEKHPEKVNGGDLSKSAARPFQIAKLVANNVQSSDIFGYSVSISGNYLVVGEPLGGTGGNVYLFKKLGLNVTQIAKIQSEDIESGDRFGDSVSIDGDYIVVGAYSEDTNGTNAGSMYVFKRNSDSNVTQISKIQSTDIEAGDSFGVEVSIDGDYILATSGKNGGTGYIFKRNSDSDISQISKIQSTDIETGDNFGSAISIDGDYIVLGAYGEDTGGNDAGAAYVFKRNSDSNVSQIAKISSDDIEAGDYFGISVSIDGDYIVVGAYGEDTGGNSAGSMYLFKRNSDLNIAQIAKIQPTDISSSDTFGSVVSISGDYMVAGASGENESGVAYVFKRDSDDSVSQVSKIQAIDIQPNDYFGTTTILIDGDNIIVGSAFADSIGVDAGAAYVFNLFPQEKPYFKSKPTGSISVNEGNGNAIFDFKAITPKNATISYTIEGTDLSSFSFNDSNLSFSSTPNFESPTDIGNDNNYSVTVVATDSSNEKSSIDVNIIVTDKTFLEKAKLTASDAQLNDKFGNSVAMDGDYIVVGADGEDTGGSSAGAVYVFKRNTDTDVSQIAKIQSNDIESGDKFGNSVSIDGDYIVVGAYSEDTNGTSAGSIYVFKRNTDTNVSQIAKIQSTDIGASDSFGKSVSISGDYITVGATGENGTGGAYIFKRNSDSNISQIAKIQSNDIQSSDAFGDTVSMDGDYIVVGAAFEDTGGSNAGAAYVFKRNSDSNVSQVAKLQSGDIQGGDAFGYSVSISGDYIVVGARYQSSQVNYSGAAYIFKRNSDSNVSQIAKIQSDDIETSDFFGNSVAIDGDYILVGVPAKDKGGQNTGTSYLFKRNSDNPNDVTQIDKFQANDLSVNGAFGSSVAIDGDYFIIGGFGNSGTSHLFSKDLN